MLCDECVCALWRVLISDYFSACVNRSGRSHCRREHVLFFFLPSHISPELSSDKWQPLYASLSCLLHLDIKYIYRKLNGSIIFLMPLKSAKIITDAGELAAAASQEVWTLASKMQQIERQSHHARLKQFVCLPKVRVKPLISCREGNCYGLILTLLLNRPGSIYIFPWFHFHELVVLLQKINLEED